VPFSSDELPLSESPYRNPALAAVYDGIAVQYQFAPPARDLVGIAEIQKGSRVLDVGTGTGAVADAAKSVVGPTGTIVAVDASWQMIRLSRNATENLIVAAVPHLPLRDDTFDAVIAGFAVSHFKNYPEGLAEMVRVCRPGGRLGMTAWGTEPNPAATLWTETAGRYLPSQQLTDAFLQHIPWDAWFAESKNIVAALEAAVLTSVFVERRDYTIRIPTADYLRLREASVQGMALRAAVTSDQWQDFTTVISQLFNDRFGDTVEYDRDVHFGIGTKD
jgi:SAM-dependent methyltransferase